MTSKCSLLGISDTIHSNEYMLQDTNQFSKLHKPTDAQSKDDWLFTLRQIDLSACEGIHFLLLLGNGLS